MKNQNENNNKSAEKTKEKPIDAIILKIEKFNKAKHDDDDEQVKIVRRTMSSEVKNGIVIAMNDDDPDYVVFAKGETRDVLSIMTASLFCLLRMVGVSINEYVGYLQFVSDVNKKKGGMK